MLAPLLAALVLQAPLPAGQRIIGQDGDVILLERGARVRVVKRSEGTVRAIYNAAQRWLVLLVDYADPSGAKPDGFVDYTYSFFDVQGDWPLGSRWDGTAAIEEVSMAGQNGRLAVNLRTPSGLYQIIGSGVFGSTSANVAVDPTALGRLSNRAGLEGIAGRGATFDIAENLEVEKATMHASGTIDRTVAVPSGALGRGSAAFASGPDARPLAPLPWNNAAVRVGGAIRPPQKIVDAQPVYPPIAQSARVQGLVILEITVAADGSVSDAKVLRSIPLLDQAAIDCVRKWKYEPTVLNGTPVPIILTVTVTFAVQ